MSDQTTLERPVESDAAEQKTASVDDKIVCQIDGAMVHSIQIYLKNNHPDWTMERYVREYPDAPVLSEYAKQLVARKAAEAATPAPAAPASIQANLTTVALTTKNAVFHDLFELGNAPAALNAQGKPINVTTLEGHDDQSLVYLPEIDKGFVFNIDLLKKVIVGFELNMPTYLWGFHGTGKTTILEQAAARTRRPFIRVQHTINMQESDILGQWTVRDGSTIFQLGPLPMAMINGWVYCADEYDFSMPSVLAVYQPVLEGKALLIKDAPPQYRKIEPNPNFRFTATGNTNGVGDETGLYQGTLVQNAANYSRFKITEEVEYMEAKIEESVVMGRAGIGRQDATRIVKFANEVRKMFREGKLTMTVSPRELITAALLGKAFGGNWPVGIELAFSNRLSRVDKRTVAEYMQRVFGA